jgi:hypothetical protein
VTTDTSPTFQGKSGARRLGRLLGHRRMCHGGLLGRYIAEERDSGRMLRACDAELCAESDGTASNDALEARLTRIEDSSTSWS